MRTALTGFVLLSFASGALAQPAARTDGYGDALPEGAVARLGTIRNRAPIASFGVRADDSVVTASSGGGVVELQVWGSGDETGSDPRRVASDRIVADKAEQLYSPALSADGKRLAASATGRVVVWDIAADGTTKQVAAFEAERPEYVRFSPDNAALVFARTDGQEQIVCVGDIATGKFLELEGRLPYVAAITVSADGKRIAASAAREVVVWDAKTCDRLARHELGMVYAEAIALDRAGGTLAVLPGREDAQSLVFDALTGKPVPNQTGPKGGLWVEYAPDGQTLLVGDRAGVRWWDPQSGKLKAEYEGSAYGKFGRQFTPARFSVNGKTLVAASSRVLHRWDAATGTPHFPVSHKAGHSGEIQALGISPDNKLIATAGFDRRLRVWDAKNGKPLMNVPANMGRAFTIEFSPDGKFVYAGSGRFNLALWDIATGKETRQYALDAKLAKSLAEGAGLAGFRITSDGKTLIAVHNGVRLNDAPTHMSTWNTETGERTGTVALEQDWPLVMSRYCVNFSPDGKFATTGGNAFPTDVGPKGNTLGERVLGPGFYPGAFSGDGKLIAYSGVHWEGMRQAQRAYIYDPFTGRQVTELGDGSGGRVALSPDGKILAAAGLEDLSFWDVFAGKMLARYKSPRADREESTASFANAIRFSPDGKFVVTAHADTTALVWAVPPRPEK